MRINKITLALLASVVGGALPVMANENKEEKQKEIEVITVSGIKASERESMNEKRFSEIFVDAVTASDIGELPERGIAEALEQLPGVAGNRDRGRSNTIGVRGLGGDFTLTTINGREVASSFGSRSVNLNLYPAEAVRKAFVMKTPMASQIEGGIGGTVEMETLRPLDVNKNIRTVSARAIYNAGSKDVVDQDEYGHRASAMFSQKLFDETFGVAIGAAVLSDPQVNNRFTIGDYAQGKDYNGDGEGDLAPGFMAANPQYREEERTALFSSIQWRPTDNSDITFDLLQSKFEFDNTIPGLSYIEYTKGVFAPEDAILNSQGEVESATRSKARLRSTSAQSYNLDETLNWGLNGKIYLDEWVIEADVAYSEAKREFSTINVLALDNKADNPIYYDFIGDVLPNISISSGEYDANDASQFRVQEANDNVTQVSDTIGSFKLNFSRDIDFSIFHTVKFGVRQASREKESIVDKEKYKLAWPQQFYLSEETTSAFPFENTYAGFDSDLPRSWTYIDPAKGLALVKEQLDEVPERSFSLADQQSSFMSEENTFSLYGQLDFDTEIGSLPFSGNLGLRVVETEFTAKGVRALATMVDSDNDGEADAIEFDASTLVDFSETHEYTNVLPTFNGVLTITDELLVRMAAGKAMTRANFKDMGGSLTLSDIDDLNNPIGTGKGGNPSLKPIESTQGDIALEWYPGEGSMYSVGYFHKEFDSAFGPGVRAQSVEELEFDVTTTIQSDTSGVVKGTEFNFRQEFSFLPGLLTHTGFSANYTTMDIDLMVDYNLAEDVENLQYPEQTLDETWNASLFYDDNKLAVRLNYGEQGDQIQSEGSNYRIRRANAILSASINYKWSKNLSFVLQGSNLTDEPIEFGQIGKNETAAQVDRLARVESSGRRIYAGFRAKF